MFFHGIYQIPRCPINIFRVTERPPEITVFCFGLVCFVLMEWLLATLGSALHKSQKAY